MAIYLTRWLLTPAAIPVNLIAGGSGYSVWSFSRLVALGELTWLLAYGGRLVNPGRRFDDPRNDPG